MMAVSDTIRQGVVESLPEANLIGDEPLRRQVIDAWALCLAGSSFRRIEEIPASGNPDGPSLTRGTQTDHIRGVTRLALAMAETLEAQYGPLNIDRDLLIAAALCHDVGKPFEFDPENQRRWRDDPSVSGYPAIRHSVYGVHIALSVGLPEAIAHVAGEHSKEGTFITRSLINTIVSFADHAFWEVLGSAGLLAATGEQPTTP